MGAIYAELRVAGHVFPVLRCEFGVHQATDRRGRVMEKVRFEPPTLVMDVPRGDFLLAWAAAAAKRLPADVVFFDAAGGQAVETLSFITGAYCVNHREEFRAGDAGSGAYLLFLTLSDPDGYRMHAGGPASAFVAPAARNHGVPLVAAFERESAGPLTGAGGAVLLAPGSGVSGGLPAALEVLIARTFVLGESDTELFRAATRQALGEVYATPTGQALLESLGASGKQVHIDYNMMQNDISGYDEPSARFCRPDGTAGAGTGSRVGFNPSIVNIGEQAWGTRPPAIALAHELIHAEQAAYGRMRPGRAVNRYRIPTINKSEEADVRELEAVGVPPHDTYPFSENKLRAEWSPPQPMREYY